MSASQKPTFPCPHCNEPVPEGARACWSCGSDADTGWSSDEAQNAAAWDNPAEAMGEEDYADFLAREGLGGSDGMTSRQFPTAFALKKADGVLQLEGMAKGDRKPKLVEEDWGAYDYWEKAVSVRQRVTVLAGQAGEAIPFELVVSFMAGQIRGAGRHDTWA